MEINFSSDESLANRMQPVTLTKCQLSVFLNLIKYFWVQRRNIVT